jgi:FkbM family methyltransferase
MTISYSSNYEDVILQRVFAGLHGGFYLDVGAGTPVEASNTFALYHHQRWRGIVIDPLISVFEDQWQAARPDDVRIAACVGRQEAMIPFWTCRAAQLSTAADSTIAHWRNQGAKINSNDFTIVNQVALSQVIEPCVIPEFHLLCIDVEGMEGEVLAGLDLRRHRPWLMCIECMLPATTTESMPWEADLLTKGYRRIYEDRANTWYLADEQARLAHHFRYGPNYTDFITTYREAKLEQELKQLKEKFSGADDHYQA